MVASIEAGAVVVLADEEGKRYLVRAAGGADRVKGVGVFAGEKLVGLSWGSVLPHGSKSYRLLRPGIGDVVQAIERKAQIVQPKDASRIVFECDVGSGARVVESGIGSGALTSVLAWAVAPSGRVTTYEIRKDFADVARSNLRRAGLDALVDVKLGDVTKGIDERGVDAVVLDIPNPWDAVAHAREALREDGHVCCYTPLVSQMEQARRALERQGFRDVRSLELMERPWVSHEMGSRPDHDVLGHTAFLTFARKA